MNRARGAESPVPVPSCVGTSVLLTKGMSHNPISPFKSFTYLHLAPLQRRHKLVLLLFSTSCLQNSLSPVFPLQILFHCFSNIFDL